MIEPLATIDNSEVGDLVASVDGFYDTKICGGFEVGFGNGLPEFQKGDTIRLPNLKSFNIKFFSDHINAFRGYDITVFESTNNIEESVCTNYNSKCSKDTCLVDLYHMKRIVSNYAEEEKEHNLQNPDSDEQNFIQVAEGEGIPETTLSPEMLYELKRCEGEAPLLKIVNYDEDDINQAYRTTGAQATSDSSSLENDYGLGKGLIFFPEREYVYGEYDVLQTVNSKRTEVDRDDDEFLTSRDREF